MLHTSEVAQHPNQDTRRARWIMAIALLLLFAADVVATQAAFTSRVPGANDFLPRWEGARRTRAISIWIYDLESRL